MLRVFFVFATLFLSCLQSISPAIAQDDRHFGSCGPWHSGLDYSLDLLSFVIGDFQGSREFLAEGEWIAASAPATWSALGSLSEEEAESLSIIVNNVERQVAPDQYVFQMIGEDMARVTQTREGEYGEQTYFAVRPGHVDLTGVLLQSEDRSATSICIQIIQVDDDTWDWIEHQGRSIGRIRFRRAS